MGRISEIFRDLDITPQGELKRWRNYVISEVVIPMKKWKTKDGHIIVNVKNIEMNSYFIFDQEILGPDIVSWQRNINTLLGIDKNRKKRKIHGLIAYRDFSGSLFDLMKQGYFQNRADRVSKMKINIKELIDVVMDNNLVTNNLNIKSIYWEPDSEQPNQEIYEPDDIILYLSDFSGSFSPSYRSAKDMLNILEDIMDHNWQIVVRKPAIRYMRPLPKY